MARLLATLQGGDFTAGNGTGGESIYGACERPDRGLLWSKRPGTHTWLC